MNYKFREAQFSEAGQIWEILQGAIARRLADGSNQWQDGYPNVDNVRNDIDKGAGYVMVADDIIVGYVAIFINDEPAYAKIKGRWLTNGDFVVFHRVAIAEQFLRQGLAKKILHFIEEFAISKNILSVKADTNFDNFAMMRIFDTLGYVQCGEVSFRGSSRIAYEKVLR